MADQLINKNIAIDLKNTGFNELCESYVAFVKKDVSTMEGNLKVGFHQVIRMANKNSTTRSNDTWEEACLPTQTKALKWLRESHDIHINPIFNIEENIYHSITHIINNKKSSNAFNNVNKDKLGYEELIDNDLKRILRKMLMYGENKK